jgi:hypothetical protein
VAFRGIRAGQPIRYVACDLSPGMLRRAKRVAHRLGHETIQFLVYRIPGFAVLPTRNYPVSRGESPE